MNAAVANGATFLKRPARSLVARHVVAATLIVVAGGVLTVSGRAQEPAPMQAALVPIGADRDLRDPAVVTSQPAPEASGVAGRAPLFVRFNKPMAAASLTSQSVTLVGPRGAEPTQVAPLGALAVISPGRELLPGSRYTLFLNGALDNANQPLPLTAIGFDTAAKPAEVAAGAPDAVEPPTVDRDAQLARLSSTERSAVAQADATADSDDWTPGTANFKGRWRADRKASPLQALPPLQAQLGATALAGQVLGMNGRAVAGVTLRVEGHEAVTDATGRFLVQGLAPGFVKMEIDGATANQPDSQYGYYAARIELKPRLTNVVPYVIWMPRLDPAGTIQISAPTTTETIVTSPRIPGLELRIPAGTVIRDRQGQIVTELNLTAIPVDRPPERVNAFETVRTRIQ